MAARPTAARAGGDRSDPPRGRPRARGVGSLVLPAQAPRTRSAVPGPTTRRR